MESLIITISESMGIWTARSCGYKASASYDSSRFYLVQRLIEKIYDYTPVDLKLDQTDRGTWVASWRAPQKEAA